MIEVEDAVVKWSNRVERECNVTDIRDNLFADNQINCIVTIIRVININSCLIQEIVWRRVDFIVWYNKLYRDIISISNKQIYISKKNKILYYNLLFIKTVYCVKNVVYIITTKINCIAIWYLTLIQSKFDQNKKIVS